MVSLIRVLIVSQVASVGEACEWKILLFLSFHNCQRMKPGKSCQIWFSSVLLYVILSQCSIVSFTLLLCWPDFLMICEL